MASPARIRHTWADWITCHHCPCLRVIVNLRARTRIDEFRPALARKKPALREATTRQHRYLRNPKSVPIKCGRVNRPYADGGDMNLDGVDEADKLIYPPNYPIYRTLDYIHDSVPNPMNQASQT